MDTINMVRDHLTDSSPPQTFSEYEEYLLCLLGVKERLQRSHHNPIILVNSANGANSLKGPYMRSPV